MRGDRLSEVFDLVEVTSVLTGGVAARGGWWSHAALHDPVKFFAMVAGRVRLATDGLGEPICLEAGDVVILSGRSWVGFETDGTPRTRVKPESDFSAEPFAGADLSTDDVLVGGCVDLTPAGRTLLLGALPPVAHVRAAGADSDRVHATLRRLFDEATGDRLGSVFAIRQYGRLLLLEVLRAYVDQTVLPPGLLRLLTDRQLRPALTLMHTEPGRAWGLDDLASAAAMSRTSFAVRFREVAGMPPLSYLNHWRMLQAQHALRHGDARVGELAAELGYTSESAFSTAFKRIVGESPLHYRRRVRDAVAVGSDR